MCNQSCMCNVEPMCNQSCMCNVETMCNQSCIYNVETMCNQSWNTHGLHVRFHIQKYLSALVSFYKNGKFSALSFLTLQT